jgi:eukaryotic-like serine/threonine-protein kinase
MSDPAIEPDDPRLLGIAREYLESLEAGRPADRRELRERHPALATAIDDCLDAVELAHRIGMPREPAPATTSGRDAGPGIEPLGDFQIVREISRGGMGVVYEAVQLSLGRRVALKVLPFAAALDARQLQRFRLEAQAAAWLQHPNIVPVHAVGNERGVHFYAMQLIEGRSLATLISSLREESAAPVAETVAGLPSEPHSSRTAQPTISNRLSRTAGGARQRYGEVARMAAELAEALDHAHAAGVVHRDIKPGNILIDGNRKVWVTDFGLAAIDSGNPSLTRSGEMIGTLRYMSPEQASSDRARADARSDIYSLGVTLYEWLTLRPAHDAEDRIGLLYKVLHVEPVPLRQLDRNIPVELETIVLKATAKSPAERYATAGEFAADLRRFLDQRPILARRPSTLDRIRKWMRRHPAAVASSLLALLAAVIVLAITTGLVARQKALTVAALGRERKRAAEAESRFSQARSAVDELIRLAEEEVSDEPFQEGLRTRLLETALSHYQSFIAERGDQPADQAMLAATRDRVQQILDDLEVLQLDRQFFLLHEPDVHADLGLADNQLAGLQEILAALPLFPGPGGERRGTGTTGDTPDAPRGRQPVFDREQLLKDARAREAALARLFSDDQRQRLEQIALQLQGVRAFRDPHNERALALTVDQKRAVRQVERSRGGTPGDAGRPLRRDPGEEAARVQQVLRLFNEDQRATWGTLTGQPFTGRLTRPPGPPGGNHGPPPGAN